MQYWVLQDKVTEYKNTEKKKSQTSKDKAKLILRRVVAWTLAVLLIMVATAAIILSIVYASAIREVSDCFIAYGRLDVCHFRPQMVDIL